MPAEFDDLLDALRAIERMTMDARAQGWSLSEGWNNAHPTLRGETGKLAGGLYAARLKHPDLLPLLDRVEESADAQVEQLRGQPHNSDHAARFVGDANEVRQAALSRKAGT